MNKVILLSDKEELSKAAFEFAVKLNEKSPILLTGVFLPPVDYWNSLLYYSYGMGAPVQYYVPEDFQGENKAITQFKELCQANGIEYRIHDKEYDDIRKELRIETRFADLLVFSNEAFYQHLDEVVSNEYIDNTLHNAECPVVIVPAQYTEPENIILAYDGSASSVFAIRQFAQLFPDLAKKETILVYVDPDSEKDFPEKSHMEELVARHFPRLTLTKLDMEADKYFLTWLSERKNALLVSGAQSRSGVSELFRKSFIRDVLKQHLMPVFIAHC